MQAVDRSSKRSNRDQPREQALVLFDDFDRVSVQISPFSIALPHRGNEAAPPAVAAPSTRIAKPRSVVALAATASNASPRQNKIQRNRRRCT